MTGVLLRRGKFRHIDIEMETHEREFQVKSETGLGVICPPAKEHQGLLAITRS